MGRQIGVGVQAGIQGEHNEGSSGVGEWRKVLELSESKIITEMYWNGG